jgi:hypothetical protein
LGRLFDEKEGNPHERATSWPVMALAAALAGGGAHQKRPARLYGDSENASETKTKCHETNLS